MSSSKRPSMRQREQLTRLDTMTTWLADGMSLESAHRRALEEWKLQSPAAAQLVGDGLQRLHDNYLQIDRPKAVGRLYSVAETVIEKSMADGQYVVVLKALELIAKIAELSPSTPTPSTRTHRGR